MYVQLWTASCVKTLIKFSAYQSTSYRVEMYFDTDTDKDLF